MSWSKTGQGREHRIGIDSGFKLDIKLVRKVSLRKSFDKIPEEEDKGNSKCKGSESEPEYWREARRPGWFKARKRESGR